MRLPGVFAPETLVAFEREISRVTFAENPLDGVPMHERTTYGKAFIQVFNLWTKSPEARRLSFSKRLARIATELLDTQGVRMWHDQSLYKEPSGGFTPWHADQQYWPMASGLCVTAWIPLHAVPLVQGRDHGRPAQPGPLRAVIGSPSSPGFRRGAFGAGDPLRARALSCAAHACMLQA